MSRDADRRERLGEQIAQIAPDLLFYFRRRVTPPEDSADLLSECFVVAWRRHKHAPADTEGFRRWMFGIAGNVLRNWSRARRRRSDLINRLRDELAVPRAEAELDVVRAAIEDLPEDQAELIRLVHWDAFTVIEAAAVLGVPESTARGRYQRARQKLATHPHLRRFADRSHL